jgi:hypothetical protein
MEMTQSGHNKYYPLGLTNSFEINYFPYLELIMLVNKKEEVKEFDDNKENHFFPWTHLTIKTPVH